MTPKELGEIAHLSRARPRVDAADLPPESADAALEAGQRKAVGHLRTFTQTPEPCAEGDVEIAFDFFAAPRAILGDGKVEAVEVERTRLEGGKAIGTGETYRIPAGIVISCIGYQTSPIPDVPYDHDLGRFANVEGRITPGLYCVGWARRGPTGTIGTNRPDGFAIIEKIAADLPGDSGKAGRPGFDALAAERGIDYVKFADWLKIDEAEIANARAGSPREKFVEVERMIEAAGKH